MNFAIRARIALNNLQSNEDGTVLLEYSLVAGLVAVAAIVGASVLGAGIESAFQALACDLPGAACAP